MNLKGMLARLEALEARESTEEADAVAAGADILLALWHGVISQEEADRQLALLPRRPMPECVERATADFKRSWQAAIERMTPAEREADERQARESTMAAELEAQRLIAQDATRYGDTYAVLVPAWVKRRAEPVLARRAAPA
jgi:hypothetical protein